MSILLWKRSQKKLEGFRHWSQLSSFERDTVVGQHPDQENSFYKFAYWALLPAEEEGS